MLKQVMLTTLFNFLTDFHIIVFFGIVSSSNHSFLLVVWPSYTFSFSPDSSSEGFGDLLGCIRNTKIPLQNIHFVVIFLTFIFYFLFLNWGGRAPRNSAPPMSLK